MVDARLWILGGAVLGWGCDTGGGAEGGDVGNTVAECIADHPPGGDDDFESDGQECASPPPGEPEVECPPITPADLAAQCDSGGHPCDAEAIMTRGTAICVAQAEGLAQGLLPWRASLLYHDELQRPVWNVANTTLDDPTNCERRGDELTLDAETGEVLDRSMWQSIC